MNKLPRVLKGFNAFINGDNQHGVLVEITTGDVELAKDIAMHIAASNPISLDAASLPQDFLDKENEIHRAKAEQSGKPANIIEKMVEGAMKKLFSEVTGVAADYSREQLDEPLRNVGMTRLASVFGSSGIAFLDMAANQVLLSQKMAELLAPDFARLGLALERFSVESVTLPEAIQKALDERISMGVVGDLNRYTQYQAASAIPLAAQNEGGLAGVGAGVGVGAAIGQAMAGAMTPGANNVAPAAAGGNDPQTRLTQLKALLDQGLITAADYDQAKAEVLKQLMG